MQNLARKKLSLPFKLRQELHAENWVVFALHPLPAPSR
jgi:hypothetical protein